MTAVAAPTRPSAGLWIALAVVAGVIVLIAFVGQDDPVIGGTGDPQGTGREGLGALRLLVEESGGSAALDVHVPAADHDVAVLATNAYVDLLALVEGRRGATEDNYRPILDWVADGGVLVTGVDVPGGPLGTLDVVTDEDLTVDRGECDIDFVDGVDEIRPLVHEPVEVESGDSSCFGNGRRALLVVRPKGDGTIVRVASMGVFFNRALDDVDNAALAARLLSLGPGRTVAFLSGPDPALGTGYDGPVNEDGEPIGVGDSGLLDLVPPRVIATIVGLAAASLLYALARGRRLGSPVGEPLPIELPSSSYVDAVGRLYGRAEDARRRSADVLRHDFRAGAARRVGMPSAAPAVDLAAALTTATGRSREELVDLLEGGTPRNAEELVDLASRLNEQRNRIERGGARDRIAVPSERSIDE